MTRACARCGSKMGLGPDGRPAARCPRCGLDFGESGVERSRAGNGSHDSESATVVSETPIPTPPSRPSKPSVADSTPSLPKSGTFTPQDPALAQEVERARKEPGRALGHYLILSELGKGGMGVVHRAWDEKLRRLVALKTIAGDDGDGRLVERFQREAEAVARVKHPNIVSVHEVFDQDGKHCLAMDLVDGMTLDKMLASQGPKKLSLDAAIGALVQVARAVHHAHEQGVVHRDLKPQNVMIDLRGRPFVLDFGLASIRDGRARMTKTGTVLGTPAYMPPEQAEPGGAVDERSDVYSLGATLYHVLAGRPPFEGSDIKVLAALFTKDPVPPSRHSRRVTPDLETICLKCLEKEPRNRYESAEALARDLERAIAGEPIAARPIGKLEKARRWAKRNKLLVLALLVLVLVVPPAVVYPIVLQSREAERQKDEDEKKKAAEKARTDKIEAAFKAAEAAPNEEDQGYQAALADVVATEGPERDAILLKALDDATAALRAASKALYATARAPDSDEESAGGKPIQGLDAALAAWEALAPGAKLEKTAAGTLARAESRLVDRAARKLPQDKRAETPSFRAILAGEQESKVEKRKRARAVFAADVLGRLGAREGAVLALGRYAFAEADDARAGHAGEALARIGGAEATALAYTGSKRFGPQGSFAGRVQYVLAHEAPEPSWEARTGRDLAMRAFVRMARGDQERARKDVDRAIELDPGVTDAYRFRAMLQYQAHAIDAGLADLERAKELDPADPLVWNDDGVLREKKGDAKGALADYDRAVEIDGGVFYTFLNRGALYMLTGDLEAASADLDRAIALNPHSSKCWTRRAQLRLRQGDLHGALADAERGQLQSKHDAEAYALAGFVRFKMGDLPGALVAMNRAIAEDPREASIWFNRGFVHEKLNELDLALSDYAKALELAPERADVQNARGRVLMKKGELEAALPFLDKAVLLEPDNATFLLNRGKLHEQRTELEAAEADLTKAIELSPGEFEAWLERGKTRREMLKAELALEDFAKAIELSPDEGQTYHERGILRMAMGDGEGAERDAERALKLAPQDARSWSLSGRLKQRSGDLEGAIADLDRAVSLAPRVPEHLLNRGVFKQKKGDAAGALADFSRAIELEPRFKEAWFLRARAKVANGDREGGKSDYLKAKEIPSKDEDLQALIEKELGELGNP